jgi:hypothetical protein
MIKPREQDRRTAITNVTTLRVSASPVDGPGRTCTASAVTEVTVRCPSEPPTLFPGAAGALLRILHAVAESDTHRAPGRERAA